jgi:MoaA/NifB/PqqE/SkfB family radical SAM enzyme
MSGRPELQIARLPTVSDTPFLSVTGVERFRRLRDELKQKYTNDRMIVAGIINSANLPEAENDAMDCGGGKKALFIASNGDLTPCELVTEFIQVPNVRRDSPIAYWLTGKGLNDFRGMTQELRNQDAGGISGCPGVIFRRKSLPRAASEFLQTFEGAPS